jgi:hypothetical protein
MTAVQPPTVRFKTKEENGWRQPGFMDRVAERFATQEDLPLENATPEEEEKVDLLRAEVLKRQGLDAIPEGFRRHHYLRGKMLAYLRGRAGNVQKAADRALICIEYIDHAFQRALQFERESPEAFKDLWDDMTPAGFFGRDKRGASVFYSLQGVTDVGGCVRETTEPGSDNPYEHFERSDWYGAFFFWYTLMLESSEAGKFLMGRLVVADFSFLTLARALRGRGVMQYQKQIWPEGEHPMPEGFKEVFLCNTPWVVEKMWPFVKKIVPKQVLAKFTLFKSGDPKFMEAMLERVDADQIPERFGGASRVPWPHGEGGDLKKGEISRWTRARIPETGGGSTQASDTVSEASPEASAAGEASAEPKAACKAGADDGVRDRPAADASHGGESHGVRSLVVSWTQTVQRKVEPGHTVVWAWRVLKRSIDGTVAVGERVLQDTQRIDSRHGAVWQRGRYSHPESATQPATLTLTFDNSFSWARKKTVEYSFTNEA